MKEDLYKMAAHFESFTGVVTLVSNAVFHSATIYNDAYKASTDYDANQMLEFGKDLGDIVRVVLLTNGLKSPIDIALKAADTVRGIIDAAFLSILPNLVHCVDDVYVILADLGIVINDFKNGDSFHLIDGIQKVGDLLSHIPDAIKTCPKVPANALKEINFLKTKFSNPITSITIAGNVLSKHAA
jgi:hypothetical protein